MSRFEKRPKTTIAVLLVLAFSLIVAASESILTPSHGKVVVRGHDSVPRPQRHLVLREWLPSSLFEFGVPDIRRQNPGGEVLDTYKLDIDSHGFIEPGRLHTAADLEIAFLGGSTTECLYVAPNRRFPFRAGRLLEEKLGVKVNSVNGGRSGNNTMHSLLALIGKVLPLNPDVVVLMHNANDLGVLTRDGGYWTEDSDFALVRARQRNLESVVRDLRDMSIPRTYRTVRRALRNAFAGPARADEAGAGSRGLEGVKLERHGQAYESALRSFVGVARAWGVRPVLLTQPQIGSTLSRAEALDGDYLGVAALRRRGFTVDEFNSAHAYFNAIVHHVALSVGVLLIDLADNDWTADELYDGLHFTDSGSERAARIIAESLSLASFGMLDEVSVARHRIDGFDRRAVRRGVYAPPWR